MILISFSYQETLRAYGRGRARGQPGYANKWYQGDMITGRVLLSEQRRHTKGGGENFSNQAKSLARKATSSSRVPPRRDNDLRTLSSKRWMTIKGLFLDRPPLAAPRRHARCSCCAGNNPLICQSAQSKFQTHMDTNTCHGCDKEQRLRPRVAICFHRLRGWCEGLPCMRTIYLWGP